jgi:hypothetical protein
VTKIGCCAFQDCTHLTSIEIPDSVTVIELEAFANCTRLTSITIPDSVTEIGEDAFSNCACLTSVRIPSSVSRMGIWVFEDCASLTEIHLRHKKPVDFPNTFLGIDLSNITLYVPTGSRTDYINHPIYSKFMEVKEEE